MRLLLALALLTAAVALACAGPEPTATPRPTSTPIPTATPPPTATPTPIPTATPPPTATPTPVPTATAGPPTPTPVYAEHQWEQIYVSIHRGFTVGSPGSFTMGPGLCRVVLIPYSSDKGEGCMVRSVHHPNGERRAYIVIPKGYRVDRGDGRWMDNCAKKPCKLVPMPEIPDDW